MIKSIFETYGYDRIKEVAYYGYSPFIDAIESKEIEFPKSSIIRPEIASTSNDIINVTINGVDEIHCDKETREGANAIQDLKDRALQQLGFKPVLEVSEDKEAGEIKIIIETKVSRSP